MRQNPTKHVNSSLPDVLQVGSFHVEEHSKMQSFPLHFLDGTVLPSREERMQLGGLLFTQVTL